MTQFIHIIHMIPEWLELASLASCLGILVCRLWVIAPLAQTEFPPRDTLLVGLSRLFGISLAFMIVSSIANLLLRASEMSGYPLSSVFPALPTVLFHTHLGRVWLIRMGTFAILTITLIAGRRRRGSREYPTFMLAVAVIASMTESASGHAADKGDFSIPEIMDLLHLLAASVWGGGLFALSLIILPNMLKQGDQAAKSIAGAAAKFSRIAGISVLLIGLSAVYQAWIYVGSFDALLESPYGRTIIAKIILFSLLLCLGAFNRYLSVPFLQEWNGFSSESRGIITRIAGLFRERFLCNQNQRPVAIWFMRIVRIEALLMAGVFLCAAMLRHDVPARHHAHLGHTHIAAAPAPEPIVSLETDTAKIMAGIPVSMTIRIKDREGKPLNNMEITHERVLHVVIVGQDLTTFAHIHPEDAGRDKEKMLKTATFPLRYTFPKAGRYLFGLDFAAADNFYTKTFSINVAGKPAMGEPKHDLSTEKYSGKYRIMLAVSSKSIKAGDETTLKYMIEKDGKPVIDLNPYLGAAMHLAVVSNDLKQFIHAHGVTPGESPTLQHHMHASPPKRFGPEIDADVVFPKKGIYTIFSQVSHQGKVLLFDFTVNVQ